MKVLFATTNEAKIKYYVTRLKEKNIDVVTLNDLGIKIDVEEHGDTPEQNAIIKAIEYNRISGIPTISMDDGLYLVGVPDAIQPGVNVRRVNSSVLNDEEMLEYYINLVEEYGKDGLLKGFFRKGIAIVDGENTNSFSRDSDRLFINDCSEKINKGYPLASIQWIDEVGKFKSELTRSEEEKVLDPEHEDIFKFLLSKIEKLEIKYVKKK